MPITNFRNNSGVILIRDYSVFQTITCKSVLNFFLLISKMLENCYNCFVWRKHFGGDYLMFKISNSWIRPIGKMSRTSIIITFQRQKQVTTAIFVNLCFTWTRLYFTWAFVLSVGSSKSSQVTWFWSIAATNCIYNSSRIRSPNNKVFETFRFKTRLVVPWL